MMTSLMCIVYLFAICNYYVCLFLNSIFAAIKSIPKSHRYSGHYFERIETKTKGLVIYVITEGRKLIMSDVLWDEPTLT